MLRRKSQQSPRDNKLVESVPSIFSSAMLKLSPWPESTPSMESFPISEGNVNDFCGYRCIAKATSAFITNTFGCPEENLLSKIFLQPPLPYFIASIIYQTQVPYSVVSAAHGLLQRYYSQLPPGFDSSKLTAHRLFMTSYIHAVREHWPSNQKVFDNEYWSRVSNFTARDIELMMDHFYGKLQEPHAVWER